MLNPSTRTSRYVRYVGSEWVQRVKSRFLLKHNFLEKYCEAEQPLKAWHDEALRAIWKKPTDIKAQYRNASILKNRRVVFNVKGNDYRLVVAVAYRVGVAYVKFVATHAQYDAVDAENVEIE